MPRVLNRYKDPITAQTISIMRPGIWGNKWSHQHRTRAAYRVNTREEAVTAYRLWFLTSDDAEAVELRRVARLPFKEGGLVGADVMCCCAPLPCHGDVLVEYANAISVPCEGAPHCKVCSSLARQTGEKR